MTAEIISFTSPAPRQPEPPEQPQPYDFWVEFLDDLCPVDRQRTILRALQCRVIDGEDAKIFLEMWPDRKGG